MEERNEHTTSSAFTTRHHITIKEIAGAIAVAALFALAIYLAQTFGHYLSDATLLQGTFGMAMYTLIAMLVTVVAPLSGLPLLPIAVSLWGGITAALLSIFGWTVGATIAYILGRHVGRPLLRHFITMEKAQEIASLFAGEKPFWSVVILRMLIPVDLLSYALGLFVPMPLVVYTVATAIGVTPFA